MKRMNAHLNWPAIESLLDSWFAGGFSRSSALPFNSSEDSWETALLAGAMFKRGAPELTCVSSGEKRPIPSPHAFSSQKSISTQYKIFSEFEDFLGMREHPNSNGVAVCDARVLELHPDIEVSLNRRNIRVFKIECTEEKKSLFTVQSLLSKIPEKPDHLFVIGGGICCDIGGFLGGLIDCRIHLVPTTLLASVDAGLGGKTGVNHREAGKNQIGLFVSFESISVVTSLLKTLSATSVRQGIAEVLKHTFLAGSLERCQSTLEKLITESNLAALEPREIQSLIQENLDFKARIVYFDPIEKNIRSMLNFGHTTAHLLESLSATQSAQQSGKFSAISHGAAVATGQLCFLRMGWAKNAPPAYSTLLEALIEAENIRLPIYNLKDIEFAARKILRQDKKKQVGQSSNIVCITPSYGCLKTLPQNNELILFLEMNTRLLDAENLLLQLKISGLFS
jgi:3-dehydroquinate synthase